MERSDDQNSEGSKSGDEFGLESIFCRFREDTRRIVNSESKKKQKRKSGSGWGSRISCHSFNLLVQSVFDPDSE